MWWRTATRLLRLGTKAHPDRDGRLQAAIGDVAHIHKEEVREYQCHDPCIWPGAIVLEGFAAARPGADLFVALGISTIVATLDGKPTYL